MRAFKEPACSGRLWEPPSRSDRPAPSSTPLLPAEAKSPMVAQLSGTSSARARYQRRGGGRLGSRMRFLRVPPRLRTAPPVGLRVCGSCVLLPKAMGKTADRRAPGARLDPVRSFNRWKKKHSHRQKQKKQLRKQQKKPEWQVEREGISRLVENYGKVRPVLGRGLRRPGSVPLRGRAARCLGSRPRGGCGLGVSRVPG